MKEPMIPFGAETKRQQYFRRFVPEVVDDGNVAFDNEILRTVVGSELHGTGLEGTEDHDEMGIYIEPLEYVVGFKKMEHYTWRSKPEGVKSEHGDTDLVLYSLRKYMGLAMQGNPSVILPLFTPQEWTLYNTKAGQELRDRADLIISKRAAPRFLGYLDAQKQRLLGTKKGHTPARPELIEQFGYDTKYAMHALRLGYQGIELMQTGMLQLPIGDGVGDYLRSVRRGELSFEAVKRDLEYVEAALKRAADNSHLRDEPDVERITMWMKTVHMEHWQWNAI